MKTTTLATIAQAAGVSVGTVSRVLSGKAERYRICPDTAERVKAAAKEHGYQPIHVQKNITPHRQNVIGLVVPSLTNQYFAEIASHVISETREMGYSVVVFDSMENEDVLRRAVATLVDRKVDGIIAAPCGNDPMWLEQIDSKLIPVVLIDRFYEKTTLSYVTTDNYNGGLKATNHLIEAGHSNIVCVQGVTTSMPNRERVAGYRRAMEAAGLEDCISVTGDDFTIRNGYIATKSILQRKNRPTAIFCLASTIMLGCLKAIREAGLRVPEDISLITFDNYFYLDFLEPPIVRIDQPVADMCTLAVKILFEKVEKSRVAETQIRLSATLHEGKSVACLR